MLTQSTIWVTFGIYLLFLLGVAMFERWRSHCRTTRSFLTAGGEVSWPLLVMTYLASLMSTWVFFAGPGGYYRGGLGYWISELSYIALFPLIAHFTMNKVWLLNHARGYTTPADFYVDRFKSPLLRVILAVIFLISSFPSFWLCLVLLLIFAVWLQWFPTGFSAPIGVTQENVTLGQRLHHLALPAITLSLMSFANIALHTRQKLIDVLNSEYVLFARARGESTWTLLRRHGLRNILLPALTLQFASFAELFGGSMLAENVFSYPGLGSAAAAAGLNADVPLLLGITLISAIFVCVGNTAANLLYGVIDPKIREVAP